MRCWGLARYSPARLRRAKSKRCKDAGSSNSLLFGRPRTRQRAALQPAEPRKDYLARPMVSAAAVAAAAVLTATGCAGAGASGSSNLGGGASLVPSDAAAFVAVDTDLSSSQWHVVDGLLAKFPARDALLTSLRQRFEQAAKVGWADDVRPALGPEVDLVALGGSPRRLVALLQPDDRAKLDALLEKLGPHVVSRQLGGWAALAHTPHPPPAL